MVLETDSFHVYLSSFGNRKGFGTLLPFNILLLRGSPLTFDMHIPGHRQWHFRWRHILRSVPPSIHTHTLSLYLLYFLAFPQVLTWIALYPTLSVLLTNIQTGPPRHPTIRHVQHAFRFWIPVNVIVIVTNELPLFLFDRWHTLAHHSSVLCFQGNNFFVHSIRAGPDLFVVGGYIDRRCR